MKQLIFIILTTLLMTGNGFGDTRYVINTSHSGTINALEYHSETKSMLSGGEDGILRVWDMESKKTLHSFRTSDYPIHTISTHPKQSHAAILSVTKTNFIISVWNWKTEQKLYTISYEKRPVFFNFSPQGTYLVVCDENWQSIRFYNAVTGSSVSKFRSGFGIVSYFSFSSKETTFMTYQPTGKIAYWNVSSQKKLTEFSTEKTFIPIGVTDDKTNIIGFSENYVYLTDLSKGHVTNSIKLDNLVFAAAHPDGKSFVCFSRPAWGSSKLYRYRIEGSKIIPGWSVSLSKDTPITSVTFSDDMIYSANKDGTINQYSLSGKVDVLFKNSLARVSDISFSNDTLAIGTEKNLVIVRSSFLSTQDSTSKLSEDELSTFTRNSPFPDSEIGLSFIDKKGLYLWPLGERSGVLSLMDSESFSKVKQVASFSKPLVDMIFSSSSFLSLESNGLTKVIAPETYKTDFQYTAQGINTAAVIEENLFVCGRNKTSNYDSPLMLINSKSGETIIIPDSADVIFDIKYDPVRKTLYTLGFEKKDNAYWTVIKKRTDDSFKNETIIYSEKSDSTNSTLALDEISHTLYFSLGSNSIYMYHDNTIKNLEKSPQLIRKIIVTDSKLFSLNSDSSITVWDVEKTNVILHFFLFEDLSWILLTNTGKFFTQGNGDSYLNVFEGEKTSSSLLDKYRLKFKMFNRGKDSE